MAARDKVIFFSVVKTADPGDLEERKEIKKKLRCKSFSWFIDNIWPELTVFDKDARAWGAVSCVPASSCMSPDDNDTGCSGDHDNGNVFEE